MFTHKKTENLTFNVVKNREDIVDKIYFDETKKIKKPEVDRLQCEFCLRRYNRFDYLQKHKATCKTKTQLQLIEYEQNPGYFRSLKMENEPELSFEIAFPLPDQKRLTMYICGENGSGKSTFIHRLLKSYTKVYKDRKIYLFSSQEYDDKLEDQFDNLKKVNIASMVDEPLDLIDLRNSLCIFDDIDKIRDKEIKKEVDDLKEDILFNGRDHRGENVDKKGNRMDDIDIIITNHILCGGITTKVMLCECAYYVVFPNHVSDFHLSRICKTYVGMNKEQYEQMKKTDSRAVVIHKHFPRYYMAKNEIVMLK